MILNQKKKGAEYQLQNDPIFVKTGNKPLYVCTSICICLNGYGQGSEKVGKTLHW